MTDSCFNRTEAEERRYLTSIQDRIAAEREAFGKRGHARRNEMVELQPTYIGIHSFSEPDAEATLIHDWRAPIASMFYEFELGDAHYDAPEGRTQCSLVRRRQLNRIEHVVIDEMQDYTPVQYEVLANVCPCKKTILGDHNQSVSPVSASSAEAIHEVLPQSECIHMHRSYRSIFQITELAQSIHHNPNLIPIERHGEKPTIVTAYLAKGLEFDQVIVPFCNDVEYNAVIDRHMLYVACTRATHKLSLTHADEPSRFLAARWSAMQRRRPRPDRTTR